MWKRFPWSRSCPLITRQLPTCHLGHPLLGEEVQRNRAVVLCRSELLVAAGFVHLGQESAIQSPFILYFSKHQEAILGFPSRWKVVVGHHVHIILHPRWTRPCHRLWVVPGNKVLVGLVELVPDHTPQGKVSCRSSLALCSAKVSFLAGWK